ncbi:hypothetical protein [Pseudonocardia sp. N23]|uniref:hypothetical protein n=1 Tax=Pseudonocardia sp. N23 TaxID=1987376 RepID=UPI000C025ED0|nr:hypothetical protein [Pseudonocardia sp. N23]GAY09488.1 hypothetical protein TOK_3753 [Pseudonocardia sp. N23]
MRHDMFSGVLALDTSAVRLVSPWFVGGVAVLAAVSCVVVVLGWRRWRHPRAGRTASVLAATALVVLTPASVANSAGSFYPTLAALLGTSAPAVSAAGARADDTGPGTVRTVAGPHGPLPVYLPAAAGAPGADGVVFPVVEWLGPLAADDPLVDALDRAITEHRSPPVVVVATGPVGADEAAALRDWAVGSASGLPVRRDRAGWAIAGPIGHTGCPLSIALGRPTDWAAAAGAPCGLTAPAGPDAPPALLAVTAGAATPADAASLVSPAQLTGYVLRDGADAPGAVIGWLGSRLTGPARAPTNDRAGADRVPS